jgi:hypothetical protein
LTEGDVEVGGAKDWSAGTGGVGLGGG